MPRLTMVLIGAIGATSLSIPALARIIEKGAPSNGYYWAVEQKLLGGKRVECFDTATHTTQDPSKCEKAKAVKPVEGVK